MVGGATNNNGHSHFLRGAGKSSKHQKNALTSLLNQPWARGTCAVRLKRYLRLFFSMKREKCNLPEIIFFIVIFQWLANVRRALR